MNAKVSLLLERMVVVLVVRRAPLPYGQLDTLTIGSRGISSCQVPERNDDQLPRGRLGCRGRSGPIGASTKSPGRVGERSASAAVAERQLRFRPIVSRFGGPSGPSSLLPTMAC